MGDSYDDVTESVDWVVEVPFDILTTMNAARDAECDLREDCD